MSPRMRLLLLLALVLAPLALLFPALRPGYAFLPMHTTQDAPLTLWEESLELRQRFAGPDQSWNGDVVDKLYPILTDAMAMREDGLLWSNRWCGGAPVLAQGLAGLLYPPNLLFHVLEPIDAYAWLAWITLALGSLLAYAFLRDHALHPLACALGALAFGLSLYSTASLNYYMRVDAAVWLPLSLLAVRRSANGGGARWSFVLALALGLSFLAGFPQISFFVAYATGLYALVQSRGVALREGRRGAVAFFAARAVCIALGICLAGPQLLTQREASDQSLREASSSLDPRVAWTNVDNWRDGAMEPACLATAVAPFLLGSPSDALNLDDPLPWLLLERPYRARHTNQAAGYNFTEHQVYFGFLPFLAALLALVLRPRAALGPWLALLAALGFAVVVLPPGVFGVPFRAIYSLPFAQIGAPSRAIAIALFFGAWAAAIGFDAVLRGGARARATAGALLAAVALLGSAAWPETETSRLAERSASELASRRAAGAERVPTLSLEQTSYAEDGALSQTELARVARRVRADVERALLLAVLGALALLLSAFGVAPAACAALLVLAVIGDLALVGSVPANSMPKDGLFARPPPVQALTDAVAADGPAPHRIARAQLAFGEVFSLLRPNLPGVYGIPDVSGYIVAASKRLAEVFAALDPATRYDRWVAYLPLRLQAGPGEVQWLTHRLPDAAGIGWLLSVHPLHEHPDPAVRASVELVYRDEPKPIALPEGAPRFHVYRRTQALPRAFLARRLRLGERPEDLVPALANPAWDPREELVMLARDLPSGVDAHAIGSGSAELAITRYEPTSVRLEKRGTGSGWAYLSDVYWPGWVARVDGTLRPIVPANHAFRAVWMNEGDTVLEMSYEPVSLRNGIALAICAFAALLPLAWIERRQRASRASAESSSAR
jgi:hypothetical protein